MSFLSHREYIVAIGERVSTVYESHLGVLQGAVLAPLLFLKYVDDMCKAFPSLDVIHYVDDITAFIRGCATA